jgi:alkylglycerol monooxygenase
MEQYGKILIIAMPLFLILVLFEKWYGIKKGEDTVPNMDMLSSLSSGVTNSVKDVLQLSISILTYEMMVKNIAIYKVESTIWTYVIAFFVIDFQGYWTHRWAHEINFFWNKHAVHHSSEEFNLACALRQSVSSFVSLFTFMLLPAALLGVEAKVIAVTVPLHLFAQFWYHTRHIDKMGFLEKIIVTPSHHRVHHAVNKEYMDKNFGTIFIFWDRWFGTFQEERADIAIKYGISRPARTWNPIKINFQHLFLLAKDAWRTSDYWDKIRIWFMPTGWRPADVERNFPVQKIDDLATYEVYSTENSQKMQTWLWVQFAMTIVFINYLFYNISHIGVPNMFLYGLFIFIHVYSYTELMDLNPKAWVFESFKAFFGLFCIYWCGGTWFGIDAFVPFTTVFFVVYFAISLFMSAYFVKKEILVSA